MATETAVEQPMPDRRSSLVEDAYGALKRAVRESEFPPGHQVSEQELALKLGMSRTPIHEAVLRLQEEGLVRILPKRGILICAIAPEDMREIFEVVIAIEGSAAELAAGLPEVLRVTLADDLDRQTDRMEAALREGDLVERGLSDAEFHRLLVERCGNGRFARIMQTVNDQSHRARVLTAKLRPRLADSVPEHRAIAAAIRVGDGLVALEASRRHRIRAQNEILPLIESFGLRHL